MSMLQKILYLCAKNGISIAGLERELGFSNGSLRRWGKISPSVDKVKKVADYFDTSIDFLMDESCTYISKNRDSFVSTEALELAREIKALPSNTRSFVEMLISCIKKNNS